MEEYINKETVIKNDIFKLFDESVTCLICKNILINPVMCMNCQNVYCKNCTEKWSKENQKCPNGCDNQNYQKCITKNEILSKLKFKCAKCGDEILYDDAKKHHDSCDSNNINVDEIKTLKVPKIARLTSEEIERIKGEGIEYISGKKN